MLPEWDGFAFLFGDKRSRQNGIAATFGLLFVGVSMRQCNQLSSFRSIPAPNYHLSASNESQPRCPLLIDRFKWAWCREISCDERRDDCAQRWPISHYIITDESLFLVIYICVYFCTHNRPLSMSTNWIRIDATKKNIYMRRLLHIIGTSASMLIGLLASTWVPADND